MPLLILAGYAQQARPNQLSNKEKKQGWTLLFDGKSSNGWMKVNGSPFPEKGWLIQNGVLMVSEHQNQKTLKRVHGTLKSNAAKLLSSYNSLFCAIYFPKKENDEQHHF